MKGVVNRRARAAAAVLAWAAVAVMPVPASAQEPSIAGTWTATVQVGGQPPAQAIYSFSPDGRVVGLADTASAGAALGEWVQTDEGGFSFVIERFLFDADGALVGTLSAHELVALAATGDEFTAQGTAEVRDADGILRSSAPVQTSATRLTADPAFTPSAATPVIITGSGQKAADIAGSVAGFKALLGGVDNGGEPGTKPTGFRTITWDRVPEALSAPNTYPSDFFDGVAAPRARGAILNASGGSLMVSADPDNAAGVLPRFGNINATYADIFHTFSKRKLFSPVGSNVVDLTFETMTSP